MSLIWTRSGRRISPHPVVWRGLRKGVLVLVTIVIVGRLLARTIGPQGFDVFDYLTMWGLAVCLILAFFRGAYDGD